MESRIDVEEHGERESKAPDNQSRKNAPFVESRFVGMLQFHVGDQHATSIPSALFPRNGVIGNFDPDDSIQTTHKSSAHFTMEWIAYEWLDPLPNLTLVSPFEETE